MARKKLKGEKSLGLSGLSGGGVGLIGPCEALAGLVWGSQQMATSAPTDF
jgi:hypothetical protein